LTTAFSLPIDEALMKITIYIGLTCRGTKI